MQKINKSRIHQSPDTTINKKTKRPNRINFDNSYLTPRENDCIQQLLQGKKYQEIGDSLGLSKRTVEFYMKNIMKKFNCRNKKAVKQYFNSAIGN